MEEEKIKKLLGLRIKQLRKNKGFTQFSLGEIIGIDQRQVAYIEGGNCFPSLRTLKRLSDIFNCGIKDLFDYEHLIEDKLSLKNDIIEKISDTDEKHLKIYSQILNVIKNNIN